MKQHVRWRATWEVIGAAALLTVATVLWQLVAAPLINDTIRNMPPPTAFERSIFDEFVELHWKQPWTAPASPAAPVRHGA